MKRFFSLLVAVTLVLSMVPLSVFAVQVRTVYWDPVSGNDTAGGLTEASAVKTFDAAYQALSGAQEGKLVMLDTAVYTAVTSFPVCDIPVTITSKTGSEGIASGNSVNFQGDTTLEHMTLTLTKASTSSVIGGGGHNFTVGEGVTCVPYVNSTDTYYFCLQGGYSLGNVASANLTVKSGIFRNIYFGTMSRTVTGDAHFTMVGGEAAIVAPSYSGNVNGNVYATVGGTARITSMLYGGCWTKGDVGGDSQITLHQGAYVYRVYCAGNGTGNVTGKVTVIMDGMDSAVYTMKGKGNTSHTGTIGGSRLVLKSGKLFKTPTDFDTVDLEIPANKTFTLEAELDVDNVTCDGTLRFSGTAKLTAASVTGQVNCAIAGQQFNNHPYITAPAGSGFVFPNTTIAEDNGVWICRDLENFQGLVLTAEKGVSVALYTGFDPDSSSVKKVEPYAVENNAYYYPALQGNYYYRASGTGYYKVKKNIYMSPEKAATKTVINVTPGKTSGLGWESDNETVKYYTDEFVENAMPSDPSAWPEYQDLFTTPAFGENRAEHQFTTQAEMEAFLQKLDDANDNMYVYSMGTSGRGQDMPLVIFTKVDLTGKTLEEAAALVVADSEKTGKLTVHHQAQMHGNEQAAGEAALGLIQRLDGAYGLTVLDSLNVYVMPRINPDGAEDNLRRIPTWGLKDPNSDMIQLETVEMQNVAYAMKLFQPHVFIDNHEGNVAVDTSTVSSGYFLVNPSYTTESNDDFRDLGLEMVQGAFQALEEKNFPYRYIDNIVNSKNMGVGRGYAGAVGILGFLIETPGISHGANGLERRVVGALTCITSFYDHLVENRAYAKSVILTEQQRIIRDGLTYEESNIVVLSTEGVANEALSYQTPTYDGATGAVKEMKTLKPKVYDNILRSRIAPTAYVLPAGEDWVADVLEIMDRHGIAYTMLPAGTTVLLQQYTGTNTEASLTSERPVTFQKGAYVFCMNQQKAPALSAMLEPDMTDTARSLTSGNGRLTANGDETHAYIAPVDGMFPIYRYCYDLKGAGGIDTVTGVVSDTIVYLSQATGSDENSGLTQAAPVATVEAAYAVLKTCVAVGGSGTVVLLDDYTIPGSTYSFPACAFPVTITSKTGSEGFIYSPSGGAAQADRTIGFQGETTLENLTIFYTAGKLIGGMKANGHKLTIGKNVNVEVPENGYYLNLYGGSYNYGDDVASTDLTVLSGTWRNAYVGGFGKKVLGDAKLTVDGADFTAKIMAQYSGGIQGNMYIHLKNTTIGSNIHGGGAKDDVNGNVEIYLGEGVRAAGLYAGNTTSGNVLGTVTVIAAGADLTQLPMYGTAQGAEGSVYQAVLRLGRDMALDLTLDHNFSLDLAGYDITGDLTVEGSLTVFDSATDDYDVSDGKYGQITGSVTGTLVAKDGYVAAANGFHKFGGHYISSVSLRPSNAGVYYTATFLADQVLLAALETGVAVSLTDLPDADFETDADTLYATGSHSVLVQNILKGDSQDIDRAIMDIYAVSFVKLPDGTVSVCENGVAYSLLDVLLEIREQYPQAYESFVNAWKK